MWRVLDIFYRHMATIFTAQHQLLAVIVFQFTYTHYISYAFSSYPANVVSFPYVCAKQANTENVMLHCVLLSKTVT